MTQDSNPLVIVTGARGMLARAVVEAVKAKGVDVVALTHEECDVGDEAQVRRVFEGRNDLVINCAGVVPTSGEADDLSARMWHANNDGPVHLAAHAGRLVHISTDCVFDGAITQGAYDEDDAPSPVGVYAETKFAGEITTIPHLTIRGSFIGLGAHGLVRWILSQPKGAQIPAYTNWWWNGSYVGTFADRVVELALLTSLTGLIHLPGPEVMPKGRLVRWLATELRPDLTVYDYESDHRRMVLSSHRTTPIITPWDQMLERLMDDHRNDPSRA